jgi:hypothetical protein
MNSLSDGAGFQGCHHQLRAQAQVPETLPDQVEREEKPDRPIVFGNRSSRTGHDREPLRLIDPYWLAGFVLF